MLDVTNRRLGMLLTRPPGSEAARWTLRIARAAARSSVTVDLFLMADGAELIRSPEIGIAAVPGVRVSVCTQTVMNRSLPSDVEGVDYASQLQLARSVADSDRFLCFR